MLKIKGNLDLETGEFKVRSTGNKTNTMEHFLMIVEIINSIMRNTDELTKDEILQIVSELYDANLKED